jgi:hypothetical protein
LPAFFTPSSWQEVAALVAVLAAAVSALAAASGFVWKTFLQSDPWDERADRICLNRGGEYLNVTGTPAQRLTEQVSISQRALAELQQVRADVPLDRQLSYGTMLDAKRELVQELERKLALVKAGRPTANADDRIRSAAQTYNIFAEELPLAVCGQGNGMQ